MFLSQFQKGFYKLRLFQESALTILLLYSESNTKGATFYQLKITWVVDVMETTKEGTLEQLRLTRRPWKKIINNMINTSWIIW